MKINENGSIFFSDDPRFQRTADQEEQGKGKGGNVFAGDLNLVKDPVVQKREEARNKAMKVITDAFSNEKKIDEDIRSRYSKISDYEKQSKEISEEMKYIETEMEKLREGYQIDRDSQEYQELMLLEKRKDAEANPKIKLTEEEKEQLKQIDERGLTEFQQRSMELYEPMNELKENLDEAKRGIIIEGATIRGIKEERLKHHPIVDAVKEKDAILDAANEEIYSMLVDEVKDHLDEEMEEEKEKAEEKAEEKKEKEEQIEEIQEKIEELERLTNPEKAEEEKKTSEQDSDMDRQIKNVLEMDAIRTDVKKEVENIADKMKLVAEDLKGLKVDELL